MYLLQRMGIKKLWTYHNRDPDKDVVLIPRNDLAKVARRKGATANRRAELWCDYGAVVCQLETALLKERQPKFCSYYGCDTRLLSSKSFTPSTLSLHSLSQVRSLKPIAQSHMQVPESIRANSQDYVCYDHCT